MRSTALYAIALAACLDAPPAAVDPGAGSSECVSELALSTLTSCGLMEDGTVRCFGFDEYGELGNDPELARKAAAVPVMGLGGVQALEGGSNSFCAVLEGGTVWCWGRNDEAQLGDGTVEIRPTPVQVSGMSEAQGVAIGGRHACAVRDDRTVWCWGRNLYGELGVGDDVAGSPVPLQVSIPAALEVESSYAVSCALLADDQGIACWGRLGGSSGFSEPLPVIFPVSGVVALSAHSHSVYALVSDGSILSWGANNAGQLGDGTTTARAEPAPIPGISTAIDVAGGGLHACALLVDGSVWCWGDNRFAQLGAVGAAGSPVPVQVPGIPPADSISAGQEHTCARAEDGSVHCWGHNCCSQLGDGSRETASPPVQARIDCPAGA